MSLIPKWFFGILIIILLEWGVIRSTIIEKEEDIKFLQIISPSSHIALSGDLIILIAKSAKNGTEKLKIINEDACDSFLLRVLYLFGGISEFIGEVAFEKLPSKNKNISIVIPCGFFTRGGVYSLRCECNNSAISTTPIHPQIEINSILNVKWPAPLIFLESQNFTTYPSKPIRVTIKYEGTFCEPSKGTSLPTLYIFQLIYCGYSIIACHPKNNTNSQVLHYEEIKGFTSAKLISLKCQLFGLPGNYVIRLKDSNINVNAPTASVYLKVDWSEKFKLTVHAKSIYPCEGSGGVSVLFEYPSCRLEGDRIRLYGRLRADVTSVASPSSLQYITESRSIPGKHYLTFDCDLFTEKFIEYCFVYVSQAITGAMADVKVSCVPTFPLQEGDSAGWGAWSPWSPCSTTCFRGIRNRYRFCDAPAPKYGARFCQGKAVETEFCVTSIYKNSNRDDKNQIQNSECPDAVLAATRPEIAAEIGAKCRCGCTISMKKQISRKILGANTQACPGRSFWLLQAQTNFVIGLYLDQLQFPCPGQYFRARDGDSLNANLLTDIAFNKIQRATETLITTGENLLLEFFSDELTASGDACVGGFLAHAAVLDKKYLKKNASITIVPFEINSMHGENNWTFWKPAHLATGFLLILMFFISIFLTLQFVVKYRKYRIAEDLDNLSDSSAKSKSRSSSTIISEAVSIIESSTKSSPIEIFHDEEEQYNSTVTLSGYKDESNISSSTLKLNNILEVYSEKNVTFVELDNKKLVPASTTIPCYQPEVKYAYPVKLKTLDSESVEEEYSRIEDETLENSTTDNLEISQTKDNSEGKESYIESIFSSPSTLRSGKETKERRNREKLLHRPGSEFSLTNPDSELELDYYDYNVANASAVPGSYLGMDPAFLIWIPPLEGSIFDKDKYDEDKLFLGTKRNSILALETEGAALTPSEYRRMKISHLPNFGFDMNQSDDCLLKKGERNLEKFECSNIRQIMDDSGTKVNTESFLMYPQTRTCAGKDEESKEDSCSSGSVLNEKEKENKSNRGRKKGKNNSQEDVQKIKYSSNQEKVQKQEDNDKDDDTPNASCKYKELIECTQPLVKKKGTINIPMAELSGSSLKSIVHSRTIDNKILGSSLDTQNPDYGIEACYKQKSGEFFNQNIRYVDDDEEDEFID